ncbi:MAG: polysaccharide deacetylase family protein [Clostridium sp.]|nr:polysaccharide deacetylase family protein [Clostridium sp.]
MKKIVTSIFSAVVTAAMIISSVPFVTVQAEIKDTKLIALTFDDGPNTTTTNDVLDILEEYNAKASFFLIGTNINEESAKSVKRAYDMGMEIDNHSKTHGNMSKMSEEEVKAEILYVDEKVMEITGEPTKFFRPPFIDVSDSLYDAIDLPFICGIDCQDYMENVTAQERAEYIMNGAKDGIIVLLHDAAGNQQTVEALRIVMPQLIEQGYEFVTLTELFERQGETPKDHILYSNVAKYPCADYTIMQEFQSDASDRIALDKSLLNELTESYAIETDYTSATAYPPVIALQRWSSTPSIWHTIQPFYFNGEKAVFLSEDIEAALQQLDLSYDDLDGVSIAAYTGEITLSNAKILTKSDSDEIVMGDVNGDGTFNAADVVAFQKWLLALPDIKLANWKTADFYSDNKLDVFDLCLMKRALLTEIKL